MQRFRINKTTVEGVQALEQVSEKPKAAKPARKSAFTIEDDQVHVTSDKFATEFLKVVQFCKDRQISNVVITGPAYSARFSISTDMEQDSERVSSQFLRERGVAASIGKNKKVAITAGPQNKLYGYLSLQYDLPADLAVHATLPVESGGIHKVHRVITAEEPLAKNHISSNAISSAYKLYDVLQGLETTGDSVTVCHLISGEHVPAYKIWRPDSGIETQGSTTFKRIETTFFHQEPTLLKIGFGVGLEQELTAIVTAPDYERPEMVVEKTPFIKPEIEKRLPFSYLRSTYDVEQRIAKLKGADDHYTLLIDQRPAAHLYGPNADIKTGLQANYPWSRIHSANKFESLASLFHKAGGAVLVVPDYFETTKPGRIAILTPLRDRAFT